MIFIYIAKEVKFEILILICVVSNVVSNSEYSYNNRVFGGHNVTDILAPYQVSLQNLNYTHVCGGSIISQRWILTAAHCLVNANPKFVFVRTGSNILSDKKGKYYYADKLVIHPEFVGENLQNDIALIRISTLIVFDENTKKIQYKSLEEPKQGNPLLLTGWGMTTPISSSDILQSLHLKYMNAKTCARLMKDKIGALITDKQICTFNKIGDGSCRGDSGGPLVYNENLVGLVSWGIPCAIGLPDIFTRTSAYEDFIFKTITTK